MFLFNSFSQPLLILLSLPFGMIGVIIGFGLQNIAMGFVAMTGVIGLMGILVNDSLVMLHSLNHLNEEKGSCLEDEDIASVASSRFRPIVITSLTTVAGLMPTAYGIMGSNSYISPMVMAMAWGAMFGVLVSLIVLPCMYGLDRDFKRWMASRNWWACVELKTFRTIPRLPAATIAINIYLEEFTDDVANRAWSWD